MSFQPEKGSHPRRRNVPWIAAAWVAVLTVVALKNVPVAKASHTYTGSDQSHLASIHDNNGTSTSPGSLDEEYCIQSYSASVNWSQMASFIEETLTKPISPYIWDGSANWRVDFWRKANNCDSYSTTERNTIEDEFRIADDWSSLCGSGFSCVKKYGPVTDPVSGHVHYKYANAHLLASHVGAYDTRARRFINHETGHILGLRDPAPGDCYESVMHNSLYGCPSTIWYPSASDKNSVTRVADRTNTW